ncbi:MAG: class I SAM-dependent methyltransferase [Candidatus Moraniibacteriota bacterium]
MEEFKQVSDKKCPVCGSIESEFFIQKYDDRFGQPDLFEYYYCNDCNVAFLGNKIQEDSLAELYGKYYGKKDKPTAGPNKLGLILEKMGLDEMVVGWLAGNRFLLKYVKDNSKVLEVGPGYVPKLKKVASAKNLDWTGLEVDAALIAKLKKDNLNAIHGTIKLNDIKDKFDYIVSAQSLEHQYDVNDFFENCKKRLKNNGRIIFSTPNFDSRYRKKYGARWINWHTPYHVTLLSKKGIASLCEKYGFVMTEFSTCTPTGWYLLQKNFKISEKGKPNEAFKFDFSAAKQLLYSILLRIYEFFDRRSGDCIYCEIKLK